MGEFNEHATPPAYSCAVLAGEPLLHSLTFGGWWSVRPCCAVELRF